MPLHMLFVVILLEISFKKKKSGVKVNQFRTFLLKIYIYLYLCSNI